MKKLVFILLLISSPAMAQYNRYGGYDDQWSHQAQIQSFQDMQRRNEMEEARRRQEEQMQQQQRQLDQQRQEIDRMNRNDNPNNPFGFRYAR